MFRKLISCLVFATIGINTAKACECSVQIGDHVQSQFTNVAREVWHCGDIKAIAGKCGRWIATVRTCDDTDILYNVKDLIVLKKAELRTVKSVVELGIVTVPALELRFVTFPTVDAEIREFARTHDMKSIQCINCKKKGTLYIDGLCFKCSACGMHTLLSEIIEDEEKGKK